MTWQYKIFGLPRTPAEVVDVARKTGVTEIEYRPFGVERFFDFLSLPMGGYSSSVDCYMGVHIGTKGYSWKIANFGVPRVDEFIDQEERAKEKVLKFRGELSDLCIQVGISFHDRSHR